MALISEGSAKTLLAATVSQIAYYTVAFLLTSAALVFQGLSWRLFVVTHELTRFADVVRLASGTKMLILSYLIRLLQSPSPPAGLFLHHGLTMCLLVLAQEAGYSTTNLKFFQITTWCLFTHAAKQGPILGFTFYHAASYLRLQDYQTERRRKLLNLSYSLMKLSTLFLFVACIVPTSITIYLTVGVWSENCASSEGRSYLVPFTIFLVVVFILELYENDKGMDVPDLILAEMDGGSPARTRGPIYRLLHHQYGPHAPDIPNDVPDEAKDALLKIRAVDLPGLFGKPKSPLARSFTTVVETEEFITPDDPFQPALLPLGEREVQLELT